VGQELSSPWSGIPQASLRSPASLRPGIIPTLHEPNVGESQHGSTTAMGFAQCVHFAALGFPTAPVARCWDFPKIARKCWDPVGMKYPGSATRHSSCSDDNYPSLYEPDISEGDNMPALRQEVHGSAGLTLHG
jgi:hypothetical protein